MKKTKRDESSVWTLSALAHLEVAREARENYTALLESHGRPGSLNGIINPAAPEHVQERLQAYCQFINESVGHAIKCWQLAGRKISTLRPHLQAARQLANGRTSIY